MIIEALKEVDILDFEKEKGVEFLIRQEFDGWKAFVAYDTILSQYLNFDVIKEKTQELAIQKLCERLSGIIVTGKESEVLFTIPHLVYKKQEK
jgi:hypothetical protein